MPNLPTKLMLLSTLVLTACSSAPSPEKYAGKIRDQLTTDIKHNGLKIFTYKARLAISPSLNAEPVKSRKEAMRRASQMQQAREDFEAQFELGLEQTLAMSAFCREGYLELFRMVEADRGELKGECNEGANDADRQKFGNIR